MAAAGKPAKRRRLRRIVVASAVLVTTIVALLYSFHGPLIMWAIFDRDPGAPFDAFEPPEPPDYERPEHWAALPDRDDAGDRVPDGADPGDRQEVAEADVFYVHPTSYFGTDGWNQSLDDGLTNLVTDVGILPNQAAVFNSCCRVYAPRYRQATLHSFTTERPAGKTALELAYRDVEGAFAHYLEHENEGRPFILASHSQGSVHLLRLLEERVSGHPVRARLIAAYVVGFAVPTDKFDRTLVDIPPCERPEQTGCLLSWNTVDSEFGSNSRYGRKTGIYYADTRSWEPIAERPLNCSNPLTWSDHEQPAAASLNLGAAYFEGPSPAGLDPAETGAVCRDGFLRIDTPPHRRYRKTLMAPGDYHTYDYALFHMNVRTNALDRTNAYLARAG